MECRSDVKILTGKPTKKNLEEIGISAGNWVGSVQDKNYWRALVNAALNLRVP